MPHAFNARLLFCRILFLSFGLPSPLSPRLLSSENSTLNYLFCGHSRDYACTIFLIAGFSFFLLQYQWVSGPCFPVDLICTRILLDVRICFELVLIRSIPPLYHSVFSSPHVIFTVPKVVASPFELNKICLCAMPSNPTCCMPSGQLQFLISPSLRRPVLMRMFIVWKNLFLHRSLASSAHLFLLKAWTGHFFWSLATRARYPSFSHCCH